MDITKVIHVYDVQSRIFSAIAFVSFCVFIVLLIVAVSRLLSRKFLGALVCFAVAAGCFLYFLGFGKMIAAPTIRYEAIVYNRAAVEKQYDIISIKDDGTYVLEPKETE